MVQYHPAASGGEPENSPPGQNLLGVCLAMLAAVLGTPYVFHFIGPFIEKLVYEAYGSRDLADFMYIASFALSGVVIFAATRMTLFYALAGIVTFGSMRLAGVAAF
jgi:hypothetical protein